MNDDGFAALGCLWLAFCAALGVAWIAFLVWAIYTLVTWAVSK